MEAAAPPFVKDIAGAWQIWLSYDYQTGQYAPAGGTAGHQPEPHTEQQAQQTAGGGPGASYYEMPAASSANPGAHGGAQALALAFKALS